MTNEEYFITYQLGYWKKTLHWNRCSGPDVAGTTCDRAIAPGEPFLKTGLRDLDGNEFYLCRECAKKEA